MGWIVGGLIEALVAFLCDLISKMMNALTGAFTSVFGADPAAFRGIFPITEKFSEAFKAIGLGIAIGLVILSCVRNMFSGLGFAGENPFKTVCRFFLACFLICTISWGMDFIYSASNGAAASGQSVFQVFYNVVSPKSADNPSGIADDTGGGSWFGGGFFDVVGSATNIVTNGTSKVVVSIILLVLMTVIAINFIKLFLEMFERYVLINLLIFFSPLAASAVTLESTMKIFSSYLKMFFGQMIMLLMNILSLQIIQSGMKVAAGVIGGGSSLALKGINATFLPFIVLLLIIAMMKVLQRIDNYARDIGLTVGITGGSLLDEIVGTSKMLSPAIRTITGGGKGHSGGGGGTAVAAAGGSALGMMFSNSLVGRAGGAFMDTAKAVKDLGKNTGMTNSNMIDVLKHYNKNGGVRAMVNDVNKARHENALARNGASIAAGSHVMNAVSGGATTNHAAANIPDMMRSTVPISYRASTARGTQIGFKEFASGLDYTGSGSPVVDVSDLSQVSVGAGGATGYDQNGDLIALTAYQPEVTNNAFTSQYQDAAGNEYWAQNLSQANAAHMADTDGKEYSVYTKAVDARANNTTNYNFEGKNLSTPRTPVSTPNQAEAKVTQPNENQ